MKNLLLVGMIALGWNVGMHAADDGSTPARPPKPQGGGSGSLDRKSSARRAAARAGHQRSASCTGQDYAAEIERMRAACQQGRRKSVDGDSQGKK